MGFTLKNDDGKYTRSIQEQESGLFESNVQKQVVACEVGANNQEHLSGIHRSSRPKADEQIGKKSNTIQCRQHKHIYLKAHLSKTLH